MFEGWCEVGVSVRETGENERSEPPDEVLRDARRLLRRLGGGVPASDRDGAMPLPSNSDCIMSERPSCGLDVCLLSSFVPGSPS